VTKRRILLGLIGANITRSLAPALFADAFAAAAIDGLANRCGFRLDLPALGPESGTFGCQFDPRRARQRSPRSASASATRAP